jgi:hypothetical protein
MAVRLAAAPAPPVANVPTWHRTCGVPRVRERTWLYAAFVERTPRLPWRSPWCPFLVSRKPVPSRHRSVTRATR